MTPLPKGFFGPPLVRYVFHPPQVSVLCFSFTKIHDRADQELFWRGPTIFGRARSLVRFPPPIRFAPPHITAQLGEGAKGLLGQGSKSLKKGSCTTKTLFCTGATQHLTGAKGIWPDCSQRPFAPSPNHFGAISLNPAICQDHSFPVLAF